MGLIQHFPDIVHTAETIGVYGDGLRCWVGLESYLESNEFCYVVGVGAALASWVDPGAFIGGGIVDSRPNTLVSLLIGDGTSICEELYPIIGEGAHVARDHG